MIIAAYLTLNGTCAEAMQFYQSVLGGHLEMTPFRGTPGEAHVPEHWRDKIMHAALTVGDRQLMASDGMPDHPAGAPAGFNVSLGVNDIAEGRRLFDGLAEGGTVRMPFQETFWSPGFGMLADRFGIPWMVNVDSPDQPG